jgi:hypothetical protein
MGFFIRKAFKAGPLRFNLSKGGIGVSAGVTGARIGLNRHGTYVYGGRHGLYYREQLTRRGKRRQAPATAGSAQTVQNGSPGRSDIFVDTGVTYPSVYDLIEPHPYPDLKEISGWYRHPLLIITALLSFAIPVAFMEEPLLWAVPGFFLMVIAFGFLRDRKWRKSGKKMIEDSAASFENNPREFTLDRMNRFIDKAPDKYVARFLPDLYMVIIQIALEMPDDPHIFAFNKFEKQIPVSDEFIEQTKKAILTHRLDAVLADRMLNEEDEAQLRDLIDKLYLDEQFIFEELQYLELASSVRREMEAPLREEPASIPLVRGEVCYGEFDDVRLLEERVLDRFQRNRVQYRNLGYEVQIEGRLTLTDRRMVITGRGSREYRMNQIADIITDLETNIIELIISGRKNPVFLTSPSPMLISSRMEKIRETLVEA